MMSAHELEKHRLWLAKPAIQAVHPIACRLGRLLERKAAMVLKGTMEERRRAAEVDQDIKRLMEAAC